MNNIVKSAPRKRIEQKEQDILKSASQLFTELGFNATSTKKIAQNAGVSEGTVFNYFASKNDILIAVISEMYAELTENAKNGIAQYSSTLERVQFLAENHVRITAGDNALLLRLIYVYMNTDLHLFEHLETTALYKLNHSYTKIFDGVILEGIRHGEIRDDTNLSAIRDLFFGGLEYAMRTLMLKSKMSDIEKYVTDIVMPLWESIKINKTSTLQETDSASLEKAISRLESVAKKLESEK